MYIVHHISEANGDTTPADSFCGLESLKNLNGYIQFLGRMNINHRFSTSHSNSSVPLK